MRFLGAAPIPLPAYVAGKLALLACWAALLARPFWPGLVWLRNTWLDVGGALLLVAGLALLLSGGVGLGGSLRMGLPREKTVLKTGGVFRLSRNPMYVGGLLTCLAAVAWTGHPVVLVLTVVTAAVHDRIVRSEERYLAGEFGDAWTQYSRTVRRYL